MGQQPGRQPSAAALTRSEVRRWHLFELEEVRHHQVGQEWVPHWHPEWSIGAVVRGTCMCSVAGRALAPSAGDLLAIAPDTVHTGALASPHGTAPALVVMFYLPRAWFDRAGLLTPTSSGLLHRPDLAQAAERLDSHDAVERWLHGVVNVLRCALPPAADDVLPGATAQRLLSTLQSAVIGGEHSVTRLARACGISRERLHRVVKRWTGMGPAEYLRAVRVNRARAMLLGGESPAEVAAACGFADQAHFTRWHRRAFGYTPGDLLHAQSEAS